jgi:hypothetical protein
MIEREEENLVRHQNSIAEPDKPLRKEGEAIPFIRDRVIDFRQYLESRLIK